MKRLLGGIHLYLSIGTSRTERAVPADWRQPCHHRHYRVPGITILQLLTGVSLPLKESKLRVLDRALIFFGFLWS
jgi:hypothetical protein